MVASSVGFVELDAGLLEEPYAVRLVEEVGERARELAGASGPAAPSPPAGAKHTTCTPGHKAARPTSTKRS